MLIGDSYQSSHGLRWLLDRQERRLHCMYIFVWVLFKTHQHYNVRKKGEHLSSYSLLPFVKHSLAELYRLIIQIIISHVLISQSCSATIHLLFRLR